MSECRPQSEILLMCPVGILISSQMQPSASLRRLISPEDRRLKDGLRPGRARTRRVGRVQTDYIYVYVQICLPLCV
jgi:hypothetical protein